MMHAAIIHATPIHATVLALNAASTPTTIVAFVALVFEGTGAEATGTVGLRVNCTNNNN